MPVAGAERRLCENRRRPPRPAARRSATAAGDARSKVIEIYEKCNPTAKLGEVDKLLAKYAGREAELIVAAPEERGAAQLGGFGAGAARSTRHAGRAGAVHRRRRRTRARAAPDRGRDEPHRRSRQRRL